MLKISIVTICFNNEKDIRATIESVVNQTYSDIEYIIKDGGSKDGTLSIVNEYKEHITKIISAPDKGLYDAINTGIKASTGDVVGLIHAGDKLYDNKVIEDIARFFENNKVDVLYGHSRCIKENGETVRINRSPQFKKKLVRHGWMPSHQSIYVKRELFEKFGYYTQNVGGSGDYEWFVNIFYKHADEINILLLDRFILLFTIGGQSTQNLTSRIRRKNRQILMKCWTNNGLKPPFALPYLKILRTGLLFLKCKMKIS